MVSCPSGTDATDSPAPSLRVREAAYAEPTFVRPAPVDPPHALPATRQALGTGRARQETLSGRRPSSTRLPVPDPGDRKEPDASIEPHGSINEIRELVGVWRDAGSWRSIGRGQGGAERDERNGAGVDALASHHEFRGMSRQTAACTWRDRWPTFVVATMPRSDSMVATCPVGMTSSSIALSSAVGRPHWRASARNAAACRIAAVESGRYRSTERAHRAGGVLAGGDPATARGVLRNRRFQAERCANRPQRVSKATGRRPCFRAIASGSSPNPEDRRRVQPRDSPDDALVLRREQSAAGQAVFVQHVNEVLAGLSLLPRAILFINPGLKKRRKGRGLAVAGNMAIEQPESASIRGHAVSLRHALSSLFRFRGQVERRIHFPATSRYSGSAVRRSSNRVQRRNWGCCQRTRQHSNRAR